MGFLRGVYVHGRQRRFVECTLATYQNVFNTGLDNTDLESDGKAVLILQLSYTFATVSCHHTDLLFFQHIIEQSFDVTP